MRASDIRRLQEELAVAIDGCRNGILWRYYHES